MPLKVSTRTVDGVMVVDCSGRIVFGDEAILLREQVKAALAKANAVVISLAGVSYIDSGGLGTLVGLYTSARSAKAQLKLAAMNERVIDLLQITKLLTVFEVHKTVDQAVASFAAAGKAAGAA